MNTCNVTARMMAVLFRSHLSGVGSVTFFLTADTIVGTLGSHTERISGCAIMACRLGHIRTLGRTVLTHSPIVITWIRRGRRWMIGFTLVSGFRETACHSDEDPDG